jgi:hypothetical protein
MPQPQGAYSGARNQRASIPAPFGDVALRGARYVVDLQMSAARVLLRTQARTAAAFGWPDWSDVFENVDGNSHAVGASTSEQLLNTAQRTIETAAELQREVGRIVTTQSSVAADNWRRGIEELGSQAQEGLNELLETARRTAEETERATQAMGQATQQAIREGSSALRSSVEQGQETLRQGAREAGDRATEGSQEAGDTARSGADAARQGAREAGDSSRQRKAA